MGQKKETCKIGSVDEPPGRWLGNTTVSQGCFPVYGLRHWDRFPKFLDRKNYTENGWIHGPNEINLGLDLLTGDLCITTWCFCSSKIAL